MLTISFSQTGKKTMLLYNDQGRLIKRIVSAGDTITIDCSSFNKGVYHTIIRYADGKSENHPFIVNKD